MPCGTGACMWLRLSSSRAVSPNIPTVTVTCSVPRRGRTNDSENWSGFFTGAEVRARLVPDITRRVWDKFAFISTVATATSYTDEPYGGVLGNPDYRAQFTALLDEFQAVAKAKGIVLSDGIVAQVVDQMERIPADTTTSMQRDFRGAPQHRTGIVDRLHRARRETARRSDADLRPDVCRIAATLTYFDRDPHTSPVARLRFPGGFLLPLAGKMRSFVKI